MSKVKDMHFLKTTIDVSFLHKNLLLQSFHIVLIGKTIKDNAEHEHGKNVPRGDEESSTEVVGTCRELEIELSPFDM